MEVRNVSICFSLFSLSICLSVCIVTFSAGDKISNICYALYVCQSPHYLSIRQYTYFLCQK